MPHKGKGSYKSKPGHRKPKKGKKPKKKSGDKDKVKKFLLGLIGMTADEVEKRAEKAEEEGAAEPPEEQTVQRWMQE